MQANIQPKYNPVVFVDGEHEIVTRSVLTSKETRMINGVSHFVIPVEISSYTHPFYSGKSRLIDTEGRIERFNKRYNFGSR